MSRVKCTSSNVDEALEMESALAAQFAEGWPVGTAEGCIQVTDLSDRAA